MELLDRSRQIIDEADRARRMHYLQELQKFDREGFQKLMRSVELYEKFVTPEQVTTAKNLILDGSAVDAEEAYRLMVESGREPVNDAYAGRRK